MKSTRLNCIIAVIAFALIASLVPLAGQDELGLWQSRNRFHLPRPVIDQTN